MEIKKTIGKIFAAVVIGFALMVLYTNAFPLSFSVKGRWVEDNDLGRVFYNKAIECESRKYTYEEATGKFKEEINKAAIEDLENYADRCSYFKYDKEKDKFYYCETYTYTWKGLSFSTSSTHHGDIESWRTVGSSCYYHDFK